MKSFFGMIHSPAIWLSNKKKMHAGPDMDEFIDY